MLSLYLQGRTCGPNKHTTTCNSNKHVEEHNHRTHSRFRHGRSAVKSNPRRLHKHTQGLLEGEAHHAYRQFLQLLEGGLQFGQESADMFLEPVTEGQTGKAGRGGGGRKARRENGGVIALDHSLINSTIAVGACGIHQALVETSEKTSASLPPSPR